VRLAVLRQSAWVIGAGLACGLPFAILAVRMADSMLWDVQSSDPLVYLAAVALLSLAGLVSAWIRRGGHPRSTRGSVAAQLGRYYFPHQIESARE
jgi:hypothetical protein